LSQAERRKIESFAKELKKIQYVGGFVFVAITLTLSVIFNVNPWVAFLIGAILVFPYLYHRGNELDKKIKESKEEAEKIRDILRTPLHHILYPPFKELIIMLIIVLAAVFGMLYFGISDEKQVRIIVALAFIAGLIPLFWRGYTKAI